MRRGRRDPEQCVEQDVIDGWTVVTWQPDWRLLLSAGLKLPGRGWLDFEVTPLGDGRRSRIRQTATFDPRGILGRAYWYAVLPIHGLMFRGMLRRIAERAVRGDRPSEVSVFTHRSLINANADVLFRWHERPEAILDLIPLRQFVRIENQTGGLRDEGRVTFSIGVGPLRFRWEARHYGYVPGTQFCDEQVRGPFKLWRHTHRIEAVGEHQSLYEDRVEYALLPGGRWVQRLTGALFTPFLARAFARRHDIVRGAVGRA